MFKRDYLGIVISCILVLCISCRKPRNKITESDRPQTTQQVDVKDNSSDKGQEKAEVEIVKRDVHSKLLIPKSVKSQESKILQRIAYVTSYNSNTRNPNWVAWHLTREHTDGYYSRKGVPYYDDNGMAIGIASFSPEIVRGNYFIDMQVPYPRQEHSDWREHPDNIDHGHMCPAADCKWDKGAMNQSFLLTNMCPQNHGLNGGDWDKLENKCRLWAKRFGDIYIIAGPIFYDGVKKTFGNNEIAIPDAFFKVVLCLNGTSKALGFVFQNEDTKHKLSHYVCTVNEVEEMVGFDFFSSLDDSVEDVIESISDINLWE